MYFHNRLSRLLLGVSLLATALLCREFSPHEAKALEQSAAAGSSAEKRYPRDLCFDVVGDPDTTGGYGEDKDDQGLYLGYCTCGDPTTGEAIFSKGFGWNPQTEPNGPPKERICKWLKELYDNCKTVNPSAKIPQFCVKYLPREVPVSPLNGQPLPSDA